jgi:mannose-6-phosphate isomerase-like protein (cupin superfamily)
MRFDAKRKIDFDAALRLLDKPGAARFQEVFRHGTLLVEVYSPVGVDRQTPHARDEAYVVVHGTGTYVCEGSRMPIKPGDFLFAPAGAVHRFEDFSDDFAVWVIFYGPGGGERAQPE